MFDIQVIEYISAGVNPFPDFFRSPQQSARPCSPQLGQYRALQPGRNEKGGRRWEIRYRPSRDRLEACAKRPSETKSKTRA